MPARELCTLAILLGLTAGWAGCMALLGDGLPIGRCLGPYALLAGSLLAFVEGAALRARLRLALRPILIGSLAGLAMTLLTYPAYALASNVLPALSAQVEALYRSTSGGPNTWAWTIVILVVEELLWRGALCDRLVPRLGALRAGAASVVLYAAAQGASGAWVLLLLGLVCGALWTALRLWTGSLWPPLLAHAVWTPTVILFAPVT